MEAELVSRAMAAATAVAEALDLPVGDAVVIHNSNKLALRLLPCDVFARVALVGQEVAAFEVELAQRLADLASPVAVLEPRVEPRVYEDDGFAVTLADVYLGFASTSRQPSFGVGVVGGASVNPSIKLFRDLREGAHVLARRPMTDQPVILRPIGQVEPVEELQRLHNEDIWGLVKLRKHEGLGPVTGHFARDIATCYGLPVS